MLIVEGRIAAAGVAEMLVVSAEKIAADADRVMLVMLVDVFDVLVLLLLQ